MGEFIAFLSATSPCSSFCDMAYRELASWPVHCLLPFFWLCLVFSSKVRRLQNLKGDLRFNVDESRGPLIQALAVLAVFACFLMDFFVLFLQFPELLLLGAQLTVGTIALFRQCTFLEL